MKWFPVTLIPTIAAFRCINFYGLETERADFVCSWEHPPEYYLQQLHQELNITVSRLPISYDYIKKGDWSRLDHYFNISHQLDMEIILDFHRVWSSHQSPVPEDGISRSQFLNAWVTLLDRYQNDPALMGVGVYNEIQINDYQYTNDLFDTTIAYLEDRYGMKRFNYYLGCHSWSNNCTGVHLNNPNAYLEIHVYPFSKNFAIPQGQVLIGEFGFQDHDFQWGKEFFQNISSYDWCFWTISHSADTGGLWNDDCQTRDKLKWDLLGNVHQ